MEPIITCRPWKPVAIKKVDPYTLSLNPNEVSIYSVACRYVKYNPRRTVRNNPTDSSHLKNVNKP